MKNKKGVGKYLSIWWFFVIILIAVTIVISNLIFFYKGIDIRQIESEILAKKIFECLSSSGKINPVFLQNRSNEEILKECGIDKKILNSNNYYIEINIRECALDNCTKKEIELGNIAFKEDCEIKSTKIKAQYYPACSFYNFYTIDEKKNPYYIKIVTASNNMGGN